MMKVNKSTPEGYIWNPEAVDFFGLKTQEGESWKINFKPLKQNMILEISDEILVIQKIKKK